MEIERGERISSDISSAQFIYFSLKCMYMNASVKQDDGPQDQQSPLLSLSPLRESGFIRNSIDKWKEIVTMTSVRPSSRERQSVMVRGGSVSVTHGIKKVKLMSILFSRHIFTLDWIFIEKMLFYHLLFRPVFLRLNYLWWKKLWKKVKNNNKERTKIENFSYFIHLIDFVFVNIYFYILIVLNINNISFQFATSFQNEKYVSFRY